MPPFIAADFESYVDLFEPILPEADGSGLQPFLGPETTFPLASQPENNQANQIVSEEDDVSRDGDQSPDVAMNDEVGQSTKSRPEPPRQRGRPRGPRAKSQGASRHSARIEKRNQSSGLRGQASVNSQQPKSLSKRGRGRLRLSRKADSRVVEKEWEIERIVDSYIDSDTCEHFYQVKWKGFSAKENTWEPKVNLTHCPAILRAYEAEMKRQR
ncbi:Testis-specific chromodomain Y 1 [Paramyrothecium foliicola]|nr:Testis-specific chromodomain Y 1 [Paramyrothecium foliicola]